MKLNPWAFAAAIYAASYFNTSANALGMTVSAELQALGEVGTLARPLTFFHWNSRRRVGLPVSGPTLPQDPTALASLKRIIDLFWQQSERSRDNLGNGLYAAIDPFVSRAWGGVNWVMFELPIEPNARILDLRHETSFGQATAHALHEHGCLVDTMGQMLFPTAQPQCRVIAMDTLRDLRIDAVLYPWWLIDFDLCKHLTVPTALFIINPEAINWRQVRVFTDTLPKSDPLREDRLFLQQLQYHMAWTGTGEHKMNGFGLIPLWPQLNKAMPQAALNQTVARDFFGCGIDNGFKKEL